MGRLRTVVKKLVPPLAVDLYRGLQEHRRRTAHLARLPSHLTLANDEHVQQVAAIVSHRWGLDQAAYFSKEGRWVTEAPFEQCPAAQGRVPAFLWPWHYPMLDFVQNLDRGTAILDLCCGIPTLLAHLRRLGFHDLAGTDDDFFQPGIIAAAHQFCALLGLDDIPIYNVRSSYLHDYQKRVNRKFQLVSHFGVGTIFVFWLLDPVLAVGGHLIMESPMGDVPRTYRDEYEVVASFPEATYRFGPKGAVTIFRRLK